MEIEKIKLNKTKSILQFGIPATIGMLMTSLITIVDGYFAGNYIGSQALVAIFCSAEVCRLISALPVGKEFPAD